MQTWKRFFSLGPTRTRVVIELTDELADISAMEIQVALHNSGYHVKQVHAHNVTKSNKKAA